MSNLISRKFLPESLVYEGYVPGVTGLVAMLVKIDHKEAIVYVKPENIDAVRDKYGRSLKRIIGEIKTDPYENVLRIRKRVSDKIAIEEEEDSDSLLELAGYDVKEEARVAEYYAAIVQQELSEDEEDGDGIDIEKVKAGVRLLERGELELFSLWILDYSDSEMAKNLRLKIENVPLLKYRIFKKLRDYYKVNDSRRFAGRVVKFNKSAPLDDFVEERLRQVSGTDTGFTPLTEMERKVLKYWILSDQPNFTMGALALSKDLVEKHRVKLYKKLSGYIGAVSMEDFIEKKRQESENGIKYSAPENEEEITSRIDFNEVIVGLRALSGREAEVFEGTKRGLSIARIAQEMEVEPRMVHLFKSAMFRKIGVLYHAPDKRTLDRRIYATAKMVDQKMSEHLNQTMNWNRVSEYLDDLEWSVLTLWRRGDTRAQIMAECAISWYQVEKIKSAIVKKTKPLHGAESRAEFEWLFDRKEDETTIVDDLRI